MNNAELIAKTQALDTAATQGPWETHNAASMRICSPDASTEKGCRLVAEAEILGNTRVQATANAEFIAEARTLLPQLAAALAQADAALAARWQPMETAPKDGSWFLVWQSGSRYPAVARWFATWADWTLAGSADVADMDGAMWTPMLMAPTEVA